MSRARTAMLLFAHSSRKHKPSLCLLVLDVVRDVIHLEPEKYAGQIGEEKRDGSNCDAPLSHREGIVPEVGDNG